MRVILIGGRGLIGGAVAKALIGRHEVVFASRSEDVRADLASAASIRTLFATVEEIDAVICCAARVKPAPLATIEDSDLDGRIRAKLLGQVLLSLQSSRQLRDNGSITLTGGSVPLMPGIAVGALVNGGLEAFVRTAALEMPRGIRLNIVSPGPVSPTSEPLSAEPRGAVPADIVARAYVTALEGAMRGQVIEPAVSDP